MYPFSPGIRTQASEQVRVRVHPVSCTAQKWMPLLASTRQVNCLHDMLAFSCTFQQVAGTTDGCVAALRQGRPRLCGYWGVSLVPKAIKSVRDRDCSSSVASTGPVTLVARGVPHPRVLVLQCDSATRPMEASVHLPDPGDHASLPDGGDVCCTANTQ
jgi:hypothetical protein